MIGPQHELKPVSEMIATRPDRRDKGHYRKDGIEANRCCDRWLSRNVRTTIRAVLNGPLMNGTLTPVRSNAWEIAVIIAVAVLWKSVETFLEE